ncbi:MFS transporter [Chloroflexota bacterium]
MVITTEQHGFLAAWQYHHYRFLWFSTLGTHIGRWAEMVVVSWLVLELTNSPFLVGLLGACRTAPMFLGPFCGTIADRYDRRRILMIAQLTWATASLIVMGLFFTSGLETWHLFVFTFIGGLSYTFDFSTRYATASDIVKNRHLVTAISLLMVATAGTSIFGPLLGGSLLGIIGDGGCFALISASFLGSYFMLLPMRITAPERARTGDSTWQNLVYGLRYVKNDRALLALILFAALANLLIFPYWFTLIPLFARDVFNMGPTGFGQLMAAIGLGFTIGSLTTGVLPHTSNKGLLVIGTMTAWSILLLFFATSRLLPFSMLLLVFVGIAQGMSMSLIQSLLVLWSSEEMRGRVSGLRAFAISTLPFGNLIAGSGASLWGAPSVLAMISCASILIIIIIAIWANELRNRSKAFGQTL